MAVTPAIGRKTLLTVVWGHQAAFAVNLPEGSWARAEFLQVGVDLFDVAWPRWVLSAATVSRVLVVKNAWNRQVSNRVACPGWGFRSGIRRTTSRPGTLVGFLAGGERGERDLSDLRAEIQTWVVWSKTASAYWIGAQAW